MIRPIQKSLTARALKLNSFHTTKNPILGAIDKDKIQHFLPDGMTMIEIPMSKEAAAKAAEKATDPDFIEKAASVVKSIFESLFD